MHEKNLDESYLPVLAVSAQPAHKLRALQCGAKDFITTPFDLPEMLIRVHNMLEIRLSHQAARNHGKKLESLALKDPLTGLANRRLLADRLSVALVHARRNKCAMAVMYLDLDGFKQINDTLDSVVTRYSPTGRCSEYEQQPRMTHCILRSGWQCPAIF